MPSVAGIYIGCDFLWDNVVEAARQRIRAAQLVSCSSYYAAHHGGTFRHATNTQVGEGRATFTHRLDDSCAH